MNGRTYRVVKVLTDDFAGSEVTEKVIWQGADVGALSKRYPPSKIWGADHLGDHEIEGGYIRWWHRFECQSDDGSWSECEDPRQHVDDPKFRELERAIDEENRQRFPGDYLDDDYDYDEDHYDDEWDY